MLRLKVKGQTSFEYAILLTVLIGALLAIQNYFKRGIQGRWKESVDQIGDQYDPRFGNTNIKHTIASNVVTQVFTIDKGSGIITYRTDLTNTIERKQGVQETGAY